jgi:putative transposase
LGCKGRDFLLIGVSFDSGLSRMKHRKCLDECLNASLFEARVKITAWKEEYNEERPHSSLGYLAPREFARQFGERNEAEVMSSGVFGVV